ncbi:MAG: hypothetical protein CMJ18_19240 [Phycisphaeraceae bacterium]|nr:hypothetical protein [Phycisphaeraceae bacterium]
MASTEPNLSAPIASGTRGGGQQHLLLLAPPLLTLLLAQLLFSLAFHGATDYLDVVWRQVGASSPGDDLLIREATARFAWLGSAMLYFVAALYAIVSCAAFLFRGLSGRQRSTAFAACAVLCAAGLCLLFLQSRGAGAQRVVIFDFTWRSLQAFPGGLSPIFLDAVRSILLIINALAVIAPLFILVATCCTAARPPDAPEDEAAHVADRLRHLKELSTTAVVMMVAGVLHMGAWLQWTAGLVADADHARRIAALAVAITSYWGTSFSLLAAVFFLPPALLMRGRAAAAMRERGDGAVEVRRWLGDHGFATSPGQYLARAAMILAPLVAAPVADWVSKLG